MAEKKITRKRNPVAKSLRTKKPQIIPNKRKDADPKDDYTFVDAWIAGETNEREIRSRAYLP